MKRIEYAELRAIGCSDKALDFYSESDPFDIRQNRDGSYTLSGIIEATADNDEELRTLMDDLANEFAEE